MKIRNTIILFVLAVGLFLYMYRFEILDVRQEEEAKELAKKVMQFEPDSVKTVRVRTAQGAVVCSREGEEWKITEPIETRGDENEINTLLTNLEGTKIERKLVDEADNLSTFGLDESALSIYVAGDSFVSDTLYIGHKNPTGTFAYAKRSGGSEVFLIPQVTISQVDKDLFRLRDKLVMHVDRETVEKFTITTREKTVTCEKQDDTWQILEPVEDQADRGSVSRVLSSVSNGKAVGFVTEEAGDLSQYGLNDPDISIDVFTGAERTKHTLLVGDVSERKFYAKDASREPIFFVNNVFYEAMNQDVKNFRNKKVLDFDRSQVTLLEIVKPEETIVCEKDTTSEWFVSLSPNLSREPAAENKINQVLSTLVALRVEEFTDDAPKSYSPYGLDSPRLEISIKGETGELARILIGDPTEENYFVRTSDRDRVYSVRGRSVSTLTVGYLDLLREEKKDEGGETTE